MFSKTMKSPFWDTLYLAESSPPTFLPPSDKKSSMGRCLKSRFRLPCLPVTWGYTDGSGMANGKNCSPRANYFSEMKIIILSDNSCVFTNYQHQHHRPHHQHHHHQKEDNNNNGDHRQKCQYQQLSIIPCSTSLFPPSTSTILDFTVILQPGLVRSDHQDYHFLDDQPLGQGGFIRDCTNIKQYMGVAPSVFTTW